MNILSRNLVVMQMLAILGVLGAAETAPFPPVTGPMPPPPAPAVSGAPSGPRIKFATPVYDFGKIASGEAIKYSFIFTNVGDERLVLNAVQPSCGCTAAGEWTKQVEPGQTGSIPLQFNTASFSGQILKTVSVTSNDKTQPSVMLQLKGTLWKPIDVTPPYGVLNVTPDATNATASVRILNNSEQPVTLSGLECNNRSFSVGLETVQPGKEFKLTLSTVPPLATGSIQGQITLKTSLTNVPVINIPAWINVQPPLSVIPPQINLGQGPLPNKVSSVITIINNSANPLALSEPRINVEGVETQVAEVQAGRTFTITLLFPQGFELPLGQQCEFNVTTSNPKVSNVRVPVYQLRPQAGQAAPNPARPMIYPRPLPKVSAVAPAAPSAPAAAH